MKDEVKIVPYIMCPKESVAETTLENEDDRRKGHNSIVYWIFNWGI